MQHPNTAYPSPSSVFFDFAPGIVIQRIQPPLHWKSFGLIAFDMDSTLITIECIDELADFAGKKNEVAAITEAAMRGEISDYRESLLRRLALMEGLHESALESVYRERLRYTPGAQMLINICKRAGLKTLLVSGGFSYFADRVQKDLGIDYVRCNVLQIQNHRLTGKLEMQDWGDVCDAEEKRNALNHYAAQLGLHTRQCIAVGDGANDMLMMQASGLSVAYHAKPAVRAQASVAINQGGLDRLLEVFTDLDA